jgi:RNA polymerase sigma-70 factor (ECF subfamily)
VALDSDEFESLFRAHQAAVYAWIVRVVRDRAAAEDLTVETFWRVWKHRATYDRSRPFAPWVRRIATHVALDHLRQAPRLVELAAPPAAPDSSNGLLYGCLEAAIHSLPPKFQAVAVLSLIEEETPEAIAHALDIPVATVKTRRARAVHLLRRKLESIGVKP